MMSSRKNILWIFVYFLILGFFNSHFAFSQQSKINTIYIKISKITQQNKALVDAYNELSFLYHTVNLDSTLYFAAQAQKISLKLNYRKGIADAYKQSAIGFYCRSEQDTAIKLNQLALNIYEQLGEKKGQGAVINNMAIIYHNLGNYDMALTTHKKGLALRLAIGDSAGIAGSYNNIANCYTDKGDYVLSLQNLFYGLLIREKMKDTQAIANSYANIGGVYYLLKRDDEAYENALKAYEMQKLIGDKEGMVQSLIALGGVLADKKQYLNCLNNFTSSLAYSKQTGNLNGEIVSYLNLGETYNYLNKLDSALHFFEFALKLSKKCGDLPSEAIAHNGIGKVLTSIGNVNLGIASLEKGYTIGKTIGNKQIEFESAKSLAFAYESTKNLTKSLFFFKQTLKLKDSIFNEEIVRKTNQIGFNYMLEKKQNEITILEKDRTLQQVKDDKTRLLSFALIIIIVALVVFLQVLNQYRLKEIAAKDLILKQKLEIEVQAAHLEVLNLVKNKTFSILSHDLKSPIASLTSVVELMDEDILSEADFNRLRNSFRGQLKSLNILLDNTLNWAKSQMTGEIKLNKSRVNVHELILQNFELFKQVAFQKEINLNHTVAENLSCFVDKNHLDIIIRNILSNAIKFTEKQGEILVQTEETTDFLNIDIIDNGIGMTKDQLSKLFSIAQEQGNYGTAGESGTGIGLLLSNDFILKNGGKIIVSSELNKGTKFTISLPKHA